MANVLLLSAVPREKDSYHRLREYVDRDRFGIHTLTDDPEAADLILFVESWAISEFAEELRRHPYYTRYREKCFCFWEGSRGLPFLPGIYHNIEKRWYQPDRIRGGYFLSEFDNPYAVYTPPTDDLPYLFSFIGSAFTHKVRERVLELDHPRSILLDSSKDIHIWQDGTEEEKHRYWKRYADATAQSKFVLCPRGQSPASVRMFDTMEMGRVPVIIADGWVAPEGPDWDTFSLRVAEKDVVRIPEMLARLEPRSVEMGLAARAAWEAWFSPEVSFHRIVEWCLDIERMRDTPERAVWYRPYLQLVLSPDALKSYVRSRLRMLKDRKKLVF